MPLVSVCLFSLFFGLVCFYLGGGEGEGPREKKKGESW